MSGYPGSTVLLLDLGLHSNLLVLMNNSVPPTMLVLDLSVYQFNNTQYQTVWSPALVGVHSVVPTALTLLTIR